MMNADQEAGGAFDSASYHSFIENQVNTLMATDEEIQRRISTFICRVRLFFLIFLTLNVGLNIIRFNLPDYQSNNST